jgi:hypothetical protein
MTTALITCAPIALMLAAILIHDIRRASSMRAGEGAAAALPFNSGGATTSEQQP